MIDVMTCALEAAWETAATMSLRLLEDDWAEMAAAVSIAVDGGERDSEQLQCAALLALAARQEVQGLGVTAVIGDPCAWGSPAHAAPSAASWPIPCSRRFA